MNDKPTHRSAILNTIPRDFPQELFEEIMSWDLLIKSPYGCSYYNAPVDWDYKEHGSLRISNHWNFSSQLKLHCLTTTPVNNDTHWTLAKYNSETGKYDVIKSIPLPKEVLTKSSLFKLARLDVNYDNAQLKFAKHTESVSNHLRIEWRSRLELSFLNQYYKLLE